MAAAWADAVPLPGLAAAAAPGAGARRAGEAGTAEKVLRYAFRVAETGFDPAQISDLYSRTLHRAHLRGAARPTTTWRGRCSCKPLTADGDARGLGRLPDLHHPHPARHLLRRRPGVQGQAARAGRRRTTSTRSSASTTRAGRARACTGFENDEHRRPDASCATRRSTSKQAVRLRPRGRRPARARPLHAAGQARASRGRASRRAGRRATCSARWRARWSRSTATRSWTHPVGTGPFRLAEWRRSSRIVLERNPSYREHVLRRRARRRRRRGPGAAGALQGPARCRWSTGSRSRSSRRSSRAGCRS